MYHATHNSCSFRRLSLTTKVKYQYEFFQHLWSNYEGPTIVQRTAYNNATLSSSGSVISGGPSRTNWHTSSRQTRSSPTPGYIELFIRAIFTAMI